MALLGGGVLAVGGVSAEEEAARCSVATLHGRYLFAFDGVQVRGRDRHVPFAAAGYEVYHGNGHVDAVASVSQNGRISRNVRLTGRYTVRPDCTGSSSYAHGEHFDLFTTPDGSVFTFIQTDRGAVATGFEVKGTARRVGS